MGIKMVDTAEPMNETGYPVARAKHIWFDDSESLQKKLDNGSLSGGGGGYTQLSQAEYDALTEDEKMNGKEYRTYDTGHIYRLGVEFGKDADISRSEVLKTYVSLYDLNTKKGLSLAWENNVDNTQKIIDALEGREEFIDSFSSSTNRIGIVGNYGTTINNFHIIKRSADLSIITATTNDGTILNRTYTNGTLSDWCVNIAVYTSLAELGLTAPVTVGDIFNAMPNKSMAIIACEGREGNTDGVEVHVSDVPISFGVLTIKKNEKGRFSIEYQNSLQGSPCNVKKWIGTLKGADGTELYWKQLSAEPTFVTLNDIGLGANATFQDVIDALPKGGSALLGVTEFTNYQTIFPYEEGNDQFARVYIVKGTADGSRMYARWFRKDGVKEAIAKFSINDNKFAGWNGVVLKGIGDIAPTTVTTFTLPDTVVNQTHNSRITYQVKNGICCVAVQLALDAVSSAVTTWTNVATGFPKPSFNISQTINSERNSSEVHMAMRITAGGTLQMLFNGTTNTMDWWTTTFTYPVAE